MPATRHAPQRLLAVLAVAAAAGGLGQARAQGGNTATGLPGSFYFGGLAAGQAQAKMPEEHSTTGVIGAGLSALSSLRDDRDLAYKVFVGYRFSPQWALEGGYFNLNSFRFTSSTNVAASGLAGEMRAAGLNLDLVGSLPLTAKLTGLARVGLQYARTSDAFQGSGALAANSYSLSQRSTNLKLGLGLQYQLRPWVALRGEVERYQLDDLMGGRGAANVFSFGLVFPFGRGVPQ